MVEHILRECVIEMVEEGQIRFETSDTSSFYVQLCRIERLGKEAVYLCRCVGSISDTLYVSEARFERKKAEIRSKKIDDVFDRKS